MPDGIVPASACPTSRLLSANDPRRRQVARTVLVMDRERFGSLARQMRRASPAPPAGGASTLPPRRTWRSRRASSASDRSASGIERTSWPDRSRRSIERGPRARERAGSRVRCRRARAPRAHRAVCAGPASTSSGARRQRRQRQQVEPIVLEHAASGRASPRRRTESSVPGISNPGTSSRRGARRAPAASRPRVSEPVRRRPRTAAPDAARPGAAARDPPTSRRWNEIAGLDDRRVERLAVEGDKRTRQREIVLRTPASIARSPA